MASSTFDFEKVAPAPELSPERNYRRSIVFSLLMLLLLVWGFEMFSRLVIRRVSHQEATHYQDHEAALSARSLKPDQTSMLLIGNSLLLEGLDYDGFKLAMAPQVKPVRFAIEATTFTDWHYGLERLFSEGSRPDRIVLCMNLHYFLSDSIRDEYSAFYLYRTSDLFNVGRDAGMGLTDVSNLFFARYSLFFAERKSFRSFILNKLDPAYVAAMNGFWIEQKQFTNAEVVAKMTPRLKTLRALCAQHHATFEFIYPPGFEEGTEGLLEAGNRAGVPIYIPVAQNAWPSDDYRDHLHLTPAASVRFTQILADKIKAAPEPLPPGE